MVGYTIITRIKLLVVISGSELRTGLTRFKQNLKSASFFKQFCPGFAIHKKLNQKCLACSLAQSNTWTSSLPFATPISGWLRKPGKKNYKTTKRSYFLRGVNEVGCAFFAHTMSLLVHNTAFRFTKLLEIGYLSICSCNTHIDVLRDKFKIPPVSFILHHSNASLISNYCIRLSSCYEEFCMLHIGRCCPPRPE